ncbi:hypothetical protein DFH27DRAFT_574515 [Peziza echinospora]|nr:hypothetical protein DFH27DRAFT_574515 [Peziza echinospora]
MQFSTAFATFVAIASASIAEAGPVIEARQPPGTFYCGSQPYYKADYTCYPANGNALCPINSGVVYQPCGSGASLACFDPANYGCSNGHLYLVSSCAGTPFDKNSYVCVDGQLCPKTHPNRCGQACYALSQYWCDNGVLKQQIRS